MSKIKLNNNVVIDLIGLTELDGTYPKTLSKGQSQVLWLDRTTMSPCTLDDAPDYVPVKLL